MIAHFSGQKGLNAPLGMNGPSAFMRLDSLRSAASSIFRSSRPGSVLRLEFGHAKTRTPGYPHGFNSRIWLTCRPGRKTEKTEIGLIDTDPHFRGLHDGVNLRALLQAESLCRTPFRATTTSVFTGPFVMVVTVPGIWLRALICIDIPGSP